MNIYKKLFELQQTYNSTKDNFNTFGKYSFRNVEQILAELKPILKPLNLIIVFNEEIVNGNNNDYIKFEAKLIEIETDEIRLRPEKSEVNRLWADNSKAKRLLDWEPEYGGRDGFRRGLKETAEWFTNLENLKKYKSDIYNI